MNLHEFNTVLGGKRVLVTGAAGFIGKRLCRSLADCGALLHGTERTPSLAGWPGAWHQVELADASGVAELFRSVRPDVVFHLAGRVTGGRDPGLVLPQAQDTLLSTIHVLCAAREYGCPKVVLAGSADEPRLPEEFPTSPYSAAKWAAAAYGRMFHALYGLPVVHARIFMVYGPGQADMGKLIPHVVASLLQGRPPRLGHGARALDWIFIDDLVDGFLRLAAGQGLEGASVELGTGELHTVREVVEDLARLVAPEMPLEFGAQPDRLLEHDQIPAHVEETWRRIGWRVQTNLRQGLEQTVEWYRSRWKAGELEFAP